MLKGESAGFSDKLKSGLAVLTLSALAVLASGCDPSRTDARRAIKAVVPRIDFDYGGKKYRDGSGVGYAVGKSCLNGTPYDPVTNNTRTAPAALVTTENNGGRIVATVTPAHFHESQLRLTGFEDEHHKLQPADSDSAQILQTYGC